MTPTSQNRQQASTRRRFVSTAGIGLVAAGLLPKYSLLLAAPKTADSVAPKKPPAGRWYEHAWRRAVVDMHIPDWDEKFLSEFNADQYVDRLLQSRAQSVVCYAQSHVGLFNYPTKVGAQHRGLKGRDIVAEIVERCRQHDIAIQLYSSLIHDRWAFDQHREWRMRQHDGSEFGATSRYGIVCPNSAYREYVRDWVREMAQRFDVAGFRFDMTFWVGVCYCDACQARWVKEVGGDLPRKVDWTDPRWVTFQHKRESWLADFAAIATGTVKEVRPEASVEHQASTFPLSWTVGVSHPLVAQNDFLQGDFYGDQLQGSFVRKLLSELTPHRPFGYETSFSVNLRDHTGRKPEALLEAKASAAIADHGAFIFIDAIDPVGTVNPLPHARMGRVFDRLMPYYAHLGGDRVADVAIYYSLDSKFNMAAGSQPIGQSDTSDTHTQSSMNAARWLLAQHVPFTVLTKRNLAELGRYHVLVLSNVHHMDREEVAAVREFVRAGGALYASGGTSLVDTQGRKQDDFLLADVFGVSLQKANWADREHYVAPTVAGQPYFGEWTREQPPFLKGYGFEVRTENGTEVLATSTLPWPAPDARSFSSIHSNPPWTPTKNPEVVRHRFGKGRVVYAASVLENVEGLKETFVQLLRSLRPVFTLEADAPAAVEATLFHQPERARYVVSLVNFQKDLPNIPVDGIRLRLRVAERIRAVEVLPGGGVLPHTVADGVVSITAPRLETLAMFAVKTA